MCNVSLLQVQSCKRAITAVVGPAKLAASCRGALSRLTTTTAEAHDADRPAGLAASCHHVAVHSLTAIHHSRGTRCRSPCRARCIVSSCGCAVCTHSQLSTTVEAHDADRPAGLAASCHRVAVCCVPAFNHVRAICTCVQVPSLRCSDLSGCQ